MEHGKKSNVSQIKQHVNKIDSKSGHAKVKKPVSRSQAKVKHSLHELAQVNKQQADCISDLERRLNEMDQLNQILQKRLIVQIIFYFWSFLIMEYILRTRKLSYVKIHFLNKFEIF